MCELATRMSYGAKRFLLGKFVMVKRTNLNHKDNIASRATQSNSVTYACSKSRWCTLALMAWANRFARIFFFARAVIVSVGKNIQIFRDHNG